jgi:hypothetical protein
MSVDKKPINYTNSVYFRMPWKNRPKSNGNIELLKADLSAANNLDGRSILTPVGKVVPKVRESKVEDVEVSVSKFPNTKGEGKIDADGSKILDPIRIS